MSQLALYRKYRSADLTDVVGQEHITQTLSAALKQGKLSHAYLFTGPRGVGKTSVARILAREINGLDKQEDNPNYLDIIEIDAASNRGIDEIRALRDKVAVAPAKLQYKVYIIDEAHMLTREAFNALLKTLEEPPAHVVFILATTEAHKLPETIISRTQRYDFHALSEDEIVARLGHIASSEKIDITEPALRLIAQMASGGMRDAISLLDQLSVLQEKIDDKVTSQFLGLALASELDEVLDLCKQGDAGSALAIISTITANGVAAGELILQLQRITRDRLIKEIKKSNQNKDIRYYTAALEVLHTAMNQLPYTANSYIPLELAIVKIANGTPAPASVTANTVAASAAPPVNKSMPAKSQPEEPSKQPIISANTDTVALCDKALSAIKEHNNSLYALLRSGGAHVEGDKLLVNCRFAFHQNRIEEHHNRALIEKVMSKTFNKTIQLSCTLENSPEPAPKADTSSELVNSAMAILGGELVDG